MSKSDEWTLTAPGGICAPISVDPAIAALSSTPLRDALPMISFASMKRAEERYGLPFTPKTPEQAYWCNHRSIARKAIDSLCTCRSHGYWPSGEYEAMERGPYDPHCPLDGFDADYLEDDSV